MTRAEVIKKVKALLEELSPFEEPESLLAIANNDVKPITSYIEETLDKAYDDVLLSVPLYKIRETIVDPQVKPTIVNNNGVGVIPLPEDFLRLHTIQMNGWQRPVNDAISSQSPEYKLQLNVYTRGKIVKPVVAINDGKIELYSVSQHTQPHFETYKYIPRTATGTTEFEDGLVDFLVFRDAIRILDIFEQAEKSAKLSDQLQSLIDNTTL